ncbi:MAG: serine/threonine-protein phosphatase [Xanthomonadaceae bacterium]|nr:serine/threonine-protein phosphatase [Xanthomonadaceae bacterium]
MEYRIYGTSDRGLRREANEDSFAYRLLPDGMIAVVADGVGGHPGGAFASALATEQILQAVAAVPASLPLPSQLLACCEQANSALRRAQQAHPGYEQMATTVVALLARDRQAALLHAGDSRCYRWRGQALQLLTRDHTLAQQMVDDGTIGPDEAERTPYRHVLTHGLGLANTLRYSLIELRLEPGDVYLLCSDGLSKPLTDAAIAAALAHHPTETGAAEALIAAANQAGGPDNIAVILIRCLE